MGNADAAKADFVRAPTAKSIPPVDLAAMARFEEVLRP
jgi:hypothetical protein